MELNILFGYVDYFLQCEFQIRKNSLEYSFSKLKFNLLNTVLLAIKASILYNYHWILHIMNYKTLVMF